MIADDHPTCIDSWNQFLVKVVVVFFTFNWYFHPIVL